MANLVKYHSDINKIPLRNFNEKEINLFFSLLFKAKEKGTSKIKINFTELRKLSNGDINSPRFIKSLENLNYKLLSLNLKQVFPNGDIAMFNLFSDFFISLERKTLEIQVHDRFYYMLNDFLTYTQFELEQLVRLRSSYSKNIYRLLKQFQSTKFFTVYLEEFRRVLCIPESYKISHIDQKVLKPAMKELAPLFPNLKLEKIKEGRKIKSLKFTWGEICSIEEKNNQSIIEIKISEKLNKALEKAKKNRFIQPLLSISNIEKLVNKYTEKQLIKGLNFSYKEITYEIKSITYLEKTIDTGIENSKKKIVVEKIKKEDIKNDSKEINVASKNSISPVDTIKGDVARWCMKNKKYSLFGELEAVTTISEMGKFLEKHNVEV